MQDRELAYALRVKILEAIDGKLHLQERRPGRRGIIKCEQCIEDIRRFIISTTRDWADLRTLALHELELQRQKQEAEKKRAESTPPPPPSAPKAGPNRGRKRSRISSSDVDAAFERLENEEDEL